MARAKLEMFNMKRSYQADSRTRPAHEEKMETDGGGIATCPVRREIMTNF